MFFDAGRVWGWRRIVQRIGDKLPKVWKRKRNPERTRPSPELNRQGDIMNPTIIALLLVFFTPKTYEIVPKIAEGIELPQIGYETPQKAFKRQETAIPPLLRKIAECESGNKQFYPNTSNTIRGVANHLDTGRFQINTKYHGKKAKELGYDLFTEEGNTKYALWLYKEEGTTPWNWSKWCWNK